MIAKSNHLQTPKGYNVSLPLETLPSQKHLFIPKTNMRCAKADLSIAVGDKVNFSQEIGVRHGPFFDQPIFSPCSGTYLGLEKHGYRNGKVLEYLKFENDGKDTLDPSVKGLSKQEIASLTQDQLVALLKHYAAVGLGGSSFPSYVKAQTKEKINTILIDGVECEPYVTADHRALEDEESLRKVIEGMIVLNRIYGCKDARICIKAKHKELVPVFDKVIADYPDSGVSMQLLGSFYPQGWELDMIKKATGIEVKPGTLPAKYGILNFNVNSMIQLMSILEKGMPIMDRYVNVNGDEIVSPKTLLVRVGTPFSALIEACGGYKSQEDEKILLVGGAMMGSSIPNDDCVVTRTVTSLVCNKKVYYKEEPCIRCGTCVLSCPAHLHPVLVMKAMKTMPVDRQKIKDLKVLNCMECGLCSYSCTSKIPLTDYMRRAKVVAKLP